MDNELNISKIGIALYTANKYAKELRDSIIAFKMILFENEYYLINELPEPIQKWIEENKINLDALMCLENDMKYESLSAMEKAFDYEERIDLYSEIGSDNEELSYDIVSSFLRDPDDFEFNLVSEESAETLKELKTWFEEDMKYWEEAKAANEMAHEALKSFREEKQEIYAIKDAVIFELLDASPFAYHRFKGDEQNIYPLYKIGDFSFHTRVKAESTIGHEATVFDNELDMIESENKLSAEDKIPVDDAIDFLKRILDENKIK